MFKIFVGNLDYKVRVEQVRELFAIYAPIEDLVIPVDPKTNRSRGFAIVMIRDPELGAAAIRGVQGRRLLGRELVVNEARKKKGKVDESEAPPVRSGPFGPRMFRNVDGRGRGNRNPRRGGAGGGSVRGPAPQANPQPSTRAPVLGSPKAPGPAGPSLSMTKPPSSAAVPPGTSSALPSVAKAKPKPAPSSPSEGAS